jgi:hypothetical protein
MALYFQTAGICYKPWIFIGMKIASSVAAVIAD